MRLRTGHAEKMSKEELMALVTDIHHLADALHNVPTFLRGTDAYFTVENMEELYLGGFDERESAKEFPSFLLREMLEDCIREAQSE